MAMLENRRIVVVCGRRAAGVAARLAGLLTASLLAGGCSILPFGHHGHRVDARAMRPLLHEVGENAEPECLAEAPPTPEQMLEAASAAPVQQDEPTTNCKACGCNAAIVGATAKATRPGPVAAPPPVLMEGGTAVGFVPAAATSGAEEALQRLMDGNKRFVEGEAENIYRSPQRPGDGAAAAAGRRAPAAMVLACSDWAIQPESAFDAQPGELFVVRVAGNGADAAVVDSAKYAIQHYDVPLIVVLGHEECGAIGGADDAATTASSAVSVDADGAPEAVASRVKAHPGVHDNIDAVVARLRHADPELSARVASGQLKIVGACYDETNGQIALEPESPVVQVTALPRD
jgi:carbonic anhydrase